MDMCEEYVERQISGTELEDEDGKQSSWWEDGMQFRFYEPGMEFQVD